MKYYFISSLVKVEVFFHIKKENNMNEKEVLKIFGENVRNQREKENISLKELSEITKIREQYLAKIENGEGRGMTLSCVFKIAEGLKTKPHKLCENI